MNNQIKFLTISSFVALSLAAFGANNPFHLLKTHLVDLNRSKPISFRPTHGRVLNRGKVLDFNSRSISLVVLSGPSSDMLSYRIQGLRNPLIEVPKGAILHVLFVNEDDDMKHDLRFASARTDPDDAVPPSFGIGTALLKPHTKSTLHGEYLEVKVPQVAGKYMYLCTVKGHAPGGMYGFIRVK